MLRMVGSSIEEYLTEFVTSCYEKELEGRIDNTLLMTTTSGSIDCMLLRIFTAKLNNEGYINNKS